MPKVADKPRSKSKSTRNRKPLSTKAWGFVRSNGKKSELDSFTVPTRRDANAFKADMLKNEGETTRVTRVKVTQI